MTLANYAELKAEVIAWAVDYDEDDRLTTAIGWAHQEIARRLRSKVNTVRLTETLNAAEFLAVPADFVALKSFRVDTSPRTTLKVVGPATAEEICANWSSQASPSVVAVEGSEFHFGPLYTGSWSASVLYWATPDQMVDDADTNAVLTAYPFLYLYGALEAIYRYLEDDNNCDRFRQMFGALLDDINKQDAADAISGPLQTQPYAGGVV